MTQAYSLIMVEPRKDIYRVIINRPGDRNSINTPLMEEIEQIIAEAEKSSARAIVFTGAGDTYFIGGADAIEMMQYDPEEASSFSGRIQRMFTRMEESPLILVAAINGLCYGGGYEFALACDFRLAGDTARMGLPEVRVGIIPGGGGTQRLPRIVGKAKALEIILRGRLYGAKEALDMGLVHQVFPKDDLNTETEKFLKPFFKNPQHALSHAKKAVQASQNNIFNDGLHLESLEFKECFKNDFFINEVCSQVKEGVMTSTKELPEWVRKKQGA